MPSIFDDAQWANLMNQSGSGSFADSIMNYGDLLGSMGSNFFTGGYSPLPTPRTLSAFPNSFGNQTREPLEPGPTIPTPVPIPGSPTPLFHPGATVAWNQPNPQSEEWLRQTKGDSLVRTIPESGPGWSNGQLVGAPEQGGDPAYEKFWQDWIAKHPEDAWHNAPNPGGINIPPRG